MPRWETSEWVEHVATILPQHRHYRIVDLCCGSGCAGILMLYLLRDQTTLIGIDNSRTALRLSRKNRSHLGISRENCRFELDDIESDSTRAHSDIADVIIANPPYIADSDRSLSLSARRWEPAHALIAEDDGDRLIRRIASIGMASRRARLLAIEVGSSAQAQRAIALVRSGWSSRVWHDSAGAPRCVIFQRPTGVAEDLCK